MRDSHRWTIVILMLTAVQFLVCVRAEASGFVAAESGATENNAISSAPRNSITNHGPISYSVKKNASLKDLDAAWKKAISQAPNVKYSHKGDNWFVIAGTDGADNYYIKSRFSNPDHVIRSFIARYPKNQKRKMDSDVKTFSRKFR